MLKITPKKIIAQARPELGNMGCKALGETVVAVQWGPWREVGMAATKGTASRNFGRGWDGVKIDRIRTNQIE